MNTKFHLQWLRLTAVLTLLFAVLAPVSPAYADSCLVTTDADSGAGSLREKIADPVCDTITFYGDYTILLASHLTIDRNVTIDGAGHTVTISGNNAVRVFVVNPGATLSINYLNVVDGRANFTIPGFTIDADGGGIHNQGTLNVTNSVFSGNHATSGWGHGGAIFSMSGALTLSNTTIHGNGAMFGGAIYNYDGTLNMMNCTISDNISGGGGVLNIAGTATLTNCTFSGNRHGAFGNSYNTATLTNCTFSGNPEGGVIADYGGTMTLVNSIVVNSGEYSNCSNRSSTLISSNNLADDESCGPGFVNSPSILLGPLADNGAPTQTMALLPGSVAIDAGNDADCPATDQRGVTRPQGAHCDIGAYEAEITTADTTPPAITLTTPAEGAVYLLGQTVNADYACQEEAGGSGLASCSGTVLNGSPIDTGSVGTKTFTVSAADQSSNTAFVKHTYQVIYNFTGFTSPVDNPPLLNTAKAGQTIPLKWRLTDADGNPVVNLAGVSVTAVSLSCPSALSTDAIEEYVTSSSGLQNLGDGYYQWNWKSPSTSANSCKTLKLDLGEGAGFEHLALFQFRK